MSGVLGTSGGVIGLLNGDNTYSGNDTFSGSLFLTGVGSGTPAFSLGVTADGQVVTFTGGGGAGSGTVNEGAALQLAYYASSGAAVSGLTLDATLAISTGTLKCATATSAQNGCGGPDAQTIVVSPSGKYSTSVPDTTISVGHTIAQSDMGGQINCGGSLLTINIPSISSTVFASGQSVTITNYSSSVCTISSTPLINGYPSTGSGPYVVTLAPYSGVSGAPGINLTSNGTSLDGFSVGAPVGVMTLGGTGQSFSGGVNTVPYQLGVVATGTVTPNCGNGPEQVLINAGAFTLAAPTTLGRCVVHVINGGSFGTVTLSGFFEGSNTGDAVPTSDSSSATVTTAVSSPGSVSWTSHGLIAGQPVYFTGGTLPTGITSGTIYYVIAAGLTTNGFEIAATPGGTAINFTGTSGGTQTGHASSQYDVVIGNAYGQPHELVSAYQ
jgi:hypothetical protein